MSSMAGNTRFLAANILRPLLHNSAMKISLIDIGSNLTHESFTPDRYAVIERALSRGVRRQVVTGTDAASSHQAAALAAAHPALLSSTAGVHPHHAQSFDASQRAELCDLLSLPQVVAV